MRDVEPGPFQIRLEVLAGAASSFDNPRYAEPVRFANAPFCMSWPAPAEATLAYSKAAHEAAVEQVRAFLEEYLNGSP